jgi:hypothetical protein
MIKKMLSFTEPQVFFLESQSKELGIGVPELVRRAVDHYRGATPQVEATMQQRGVSRRVQTEPEVDVGIWVENESGKLKPTKLYEMDGKGYVEGVDGQRYGIYFHNRHDRDVEVVVSVDGLDICTGKEATTKAEGHIVRRGQKYVFQGFRTSMEEVASFRFGGIEESYASKMGKPRNVGVIGLAVFPEKPKPPPKPRRDRTYTLSSAGGQSMGSSHNMMEGMGGMMPAAASVPVAEACSEEYSSGVIPDTAATTKRSRQKSVSKGISKGLGTTFGEARQDRVVEVQFDRESETPWQTMTIRYDTLANLKELGVVTDESLHERENADPFPAGKSFCPAPPSGDQSW